LKTSLYYKNIIPRTYFGDCLSILREVH